MIFVFPKRREIFGQLDMVLRDVMLAICGILEVCTVIFVERVICIGSTSDVIMIS